MITINHNSPIPIYQQLVDEIKIMIETGELSAGDSLPTIRALAKQIDVANNTIVRAYQELESQSIIESGGRKGTFVKAKPRAVQTDRSKSGAFKQPILELIRSGLEKHEIEQLFSETMSIYF